MKIFYFCSVIFLLSLGLFLAVSFVNAQSAPEFLISWRAESYVPPDFQGKPLPIAGSPLTVSFELLEAGKPISLAGKEIYWFIDEKSFSAGRGKQSVTFPTPAEKKGFIDVRIEVPHPKRVGEVLTQTVSIPIVEPEAVIYAPYPGRRLYGSVITVSALPFFFNVKNTEELSFYWEVNGKQPTSLDKPEVFEIIFPTAQNKGVKVNIGLIIHNIKNELEAAQKTIELSF